MTGSVLILGGSGRFGRHAAEAFWNRGWRVRIFDRARDDLARAAAGHDVIVAGWNPPYDRWAAEVAPQTRAVIDAARDAGATVIVPGNVYVYGEGSSEVLCVDTPHGAQNPLGRIRAEMEDAWRASGVPVILLRAGDFIDTGPTGNWFDRVITKRVGHGRFVYPGDPDIPHAWAWLPDLAALAEHLAARRRSLPRFAEVPFPGYTLTGRQITALCERALGRNVRLSGMSWMPLRATAPVWPMARHLLEMRYLWNMPHRLDGSVLSALAPDFRPTPPTEAIARALGIKLDPDETVTRDALAA